MKKGIDVSEHQGNIDFAAVKAAGIEFAMIRAGYGWTTQDKKFEQNVNGFLNAGIPIGAYWFIYATNVNEAIQNADKCIKVLSKFKGKFTYPIGCDYEYDSDSYSEKQGVKQNKASRTAIIEAFCDRLEEAGYYVSAYLNKDYIANKLNYNELTQFDLWLAQWGVEKPYRECGMWQHSDELRIAGNIFDADIAYKDYEQIITGAGLNHTTKAAVATAPKPVKFQTYYVRKGDTLTAIANRFGTTVQQIAADNNIKNVNLIYVAQPLKIRC
ncbi:MAG: LysM peptidoglycan-binding domain-containing protein [Clostridia bacterium]|nr:LysM peptidoglycan-binding domain-containing protein [Clostridia bacterium]